MYWESVCGKALSELVNFSLKERDSLMLLCAICGGILVCFGNKVLKGMVDSCYIIWRTRHRPSFARKREEFAFLSNDHHFALASSIMLTAESIT